MSVPNLFLVGAPRAGTTTLFHQLGQSPEVFVPALKEPNHLSPALQAGIAGPAAGRLGRMSTFDRDHYEALFRGGRAARWRLDGSTSYFADPDAAKAIQELSPDARILIVLREPASRAASAHAYLRRDGLEPVEDLAQALADEDERRAAGWPPIYWYRDTGRYAEHVVRFLSLFSSEQVLVVLHDDLRRDLPAVVRAVATFLGIEVPTISSVETRNESGAPRSRLVHRVLAHPSRLRAEVRQRSPRWVHDLVVRMRSANLVEVAHPDAQVLMELRAGLRGEVAKAGELIERPDLSRLWGFE